MSVVFIVEDNLADAEAIAEVFRSIGIIPKLHRTAVTE